MVYFSVHVYLYDVAPLLFCLEVMLVKGIALLRQAQYLTTELISFPVCFTVYMIIILFRVGIICCSCFCSR